MKNWIVLVYILIFLPKVTLGQSYDSSILFEAQKGNDTYCGEMTPIVIIPHMTYPYKEVHFMVNIDEDQFIVVQTFSQSEIEYNDNSFFSSYQFDDEWCYEYSINYTCYELSTDSTFEIEIEHKSRSILKLTALANNYMSPIDTFQVYAIEDFGIIPLLELEALGYDGFELSGLELNDIYYPISEDDCSPITNENPLFPSVETSNSTHSIDASESIKYAYNKYGTIISIHHTEGCDLDIYEHTEGEVKLLTSQPAVYDFHINTDHFFDKNLIAGHFNSTIGQTISYSIIKNGNHYQFITAEIPSMVYNVSPLKKYSNLIFQMGKVEINDISGNTHSILNTTKQYSYGSLFQSDLLVFYEKAKKTMHLYDSNLQLIQDFDLLFSNIDGFKILNNNFVTWRGNSLSVFNFQTSTSFNFDENADINSISIHGDEMTWKSIDGNAYKKLSFDSNHNIIIEDQPLIDEFDTPQFCYWNDSILIYADTRTIEFGNTEIIESSLYSSNSIDNLPLL